ncbi:MAG: acyl carrier protein [Fibrobacter sp.]|jgi:acyl carrier protein|nr:acyl carrier protein [Fibrobacter sp.]
MNVEREEKIKTRREILQKLKEEMIKRLDLPYKPDDIHEDISLLGAGLGLDSLDAIEIVMIVESCFNVKIADGNTSPLRSLNTITDYIIAQKGL